MSDALPIAQTLQQVAAVDGPVQYIPHAPAGSWDTFLAEKGPVDDWDVNALLCNLVDYVFQCVGNPMLISQLFSTPRDQAPSYKVLCYNLSYEQLINLDARADPQWFRSIVLSPSGPLYDAKLTPSRTLMKLIYQTVI